MLSTTAARDAAFSYFGQVYGDQFTNLALEEIELSDDERYWYVTIGFDIPTQHPAALVLQLPPKRGYKVLKIDAQNGSVKSMKMRKAG